MRDLDKLDAHRRERFAEFQYEVARRSPSCHVRLNQNAKTMLSMRHRRQGGRVVSIHAGLLDYATALRDVLDWIASDGRRMTRDLRAALQAVWRDQRQAELINHPLVLPPLDVITVPFDLAAMFAYVHSTWFSHLPRPAIHWARRGPRRTLTSIRFACYRARPHPLIVVNPRLAQPWVAKIFAEHVLYHELCHHAQACAPIRGESPHSQRFRTLESQYPHHQLAIAWERAHLVRFLAW
jgi:predicted SprT family Zn-dependent metalloprotease